MKKQIEELWSTVSDSLSDELDKAHEDAVIWGTGFIAIGPDMEFKHISFEEALKRAEFIDKNRFRHPSPDDATGEK